MNEPLMDLWEPPDEPPPGVHRPLLWRLAVRLYRDHRGRPDAAGFAVCRTCGEVWPCTGRRVAERGMVSAYAAD